MPKSNVKMSCPNCKHVFIPTIEEVQSRAGRSARSKGHAFERRIAKQLQDWWNENGKYNYEFRRSPQSGGSALKVGFDLAGDISSNASDFKFSVECKNTNTWDGLHQALTAEKFALWDWIDQAIKDCPPHRTPMVIFTKANHPSYCAMIASGIVRDVISRSSIKTISLVRRVVAGKDQMNGAAVTYDEPLLIWLFEDMLNTKPSMWKWS